MFDNLGLTFEELRQKNLERDRESFKHIDTWSLPDFGNALAGEVGEACNLIKKQHRGDSIPRSEIAKELADVVIYADLIAAKLGISLGVCIEQKFNEVSERIGSEVRL